MCYRLLAQAGRTVLIFFFYAFGINIVEALLFIPTALLLLVPRQILAWLGDRIATVLSVFGTYTDRRGVTHTLSPVGALGASNFPLPESIGHANHDFPAEPALSLGNLQVLQSLINMSYEEWVIVEDILTTWSSEAGNRELVRDIRWSGGYEVSSISWRDPDGNPTPPEAMDTQVFLAKIDNAAIVTFRGTEPFEVADWMTDYNIFRNGDDSMYGHVHPGFHLALGLNGNLNELPGIRSTIKELGPPQDFQVSLFNLLENKLGELVKDVQNAKLYVAGHSLGGALAVVFATAWHIRQETRRNSGKVQNKLPTLAGVFTIGQPLVGDTRFALEVNSRLNVCAKDPMYIRMVNCNDIVPSVPPPVTPGLGLITYQHSGRLWYVNAIGAICPLISQPSITLGLVILVSITSAFRMTYDWIKARVFGHIHNGQEVPPLTLVLAHWAIFFFALLPHGVLQHFPAHYSQAIMNA